MIRFIAVAALALAVGTSAHAMTAAPLERKSAKPAAQVGYELTASAWPEPPSAKPVDVRDGAEAFASCGTKICQLFKRSVSGDWFNIGGLLMMKATCNANRISDNNCASENSAHRKFPLS